MAETHEYENLIAGAQQKLVNRDATVAINQTWVRGQLVGKLTAEPHNWQECDFQAVSSFDDFGIAAEAVDTNDGNTANTTVYIKGEFNERRVTFTYGDDADDWREALMVHDIILRKSVSTTGEG